MGTAIGYLDGPRLRRSLLAAAAWVGAGRDELNRINVFPVPDGDTGTNFTLTLRSIADALHRLGDAPLPEVMRAAAQASVTGARGNSGMMLSHFLLGFSDGIGERVRVRAHELAAAFRHGFERLQSALEDPVEGTILSVCREAAVGAEWAASEHVDILPVIRITLAHADQALQRTPDQLAVLKAAGVATLLMERHVRSALRVADYVDVMSRGQILYEGAPADLRGRQEILQQHLGV